jgi:nucleotide-binding universal stress UspA family protein
VVSFRSSLRPKVEQRIPTRFKVVMPVSGGENDARIIETACKVGRQHAAEITLVYVVEVEQSMPLDAELPDEISHGEAVLRDASHTAQSRIENQMGHIYTELLQARSAGAAIVDEATDKNADAIIIGASLRRQFGRLTIGDTVDYVLKNAPCEVIVIRQALQDWAAESMEWS